jgi:tetratricopeptide (TPR) repeat protein
MGSPRAPFDQGLFLAHFNKGKDHYDAKRFAEAELELEEAYLLRPRDQKVLNLLGLVYFKQEKLEKAEEVYRKLAAESPDAHTLFYNLGLIYFKLQRLEEAESAFNKALDLLGDSPKINFYLGSIYERMRRYQDAIYQYRQAGANLLVRRVEDKILAGKQARARAAHAPAAPPPTATVPVKAKGDDTAKFRVRDIQEQLASFVPPKPVTPVSPALMAVDAPPVTDTARFRLQDLEFPATDRTLPPPPRSDAQPARGDVFRFLENNLMEIDFSGKVFIKQGTIYSYGGNLTFWVKEKRPGGHPPLVMVTGTGRVILTDTKREITFMQVEGDTLYVEPAHLLACEATLTPRYVSVGGTGSSLEFLALDGQGKVALSVASKPLPLAVSAEMPVSVPASSIISWSGALTPHAVEDQQVYEVMMSAGRASGPLIRLEGTGRLLVEQTLL